MKQEFIPGIVDPFMMISLLPVPEIHALIIPIFFDMINCEYFYRISSQSVGGHNFDEYTVPHQLITTLDTQVINGKGDLLFRNSFQRL